VLAIGLVGGWLLVRRALRPIQAISDAAEHISASSLSRRIDVSSTESELGQLARVLNSTFDRLQAAFEQQAQFTADASHELRTPVSVILAQTGTARRRERTPEEYCQVVDACFSAAERMKVLIEGLLTLARSDSGDLGLEAENFDLKKTVEESVTLLEPFAAERGVVVETELQRVLMEGDPDRLSQVVTNLLSNAIRYNREGGRVGLQLEEDATQALLRFSDTGIGISTDDLPHVFDRFYRVDAARSSTRAGTGLGLAISKAIVEAHGGAVSCESVLDEGSVFTVRLPKCSTV
jgi:heavy metal sensor kinase